MLGDVSMLNTWVDITSLENSTALRGDIVGDISVALDGSTDSSLIDDDILEDVILVSCVILIGNVVLEIIFAELVALLEIIVRLLYDAVLIIDCGDISVILVDSVLVTVNITEAAVVEPIIFSDVVVGDTSLTDMQVSFEPIHFPLAKLKVHNVTCLLVWPPNINPSLLTSASELHRK